MAFDGVMMHYVKEEIKSVALDARVSQIHQPNRDELVIALRTKNGNKSYLYLQGQIHHEFALQNILLKILQHHQCFVCYLEKD